MAITPIIISGDAAIANKAIGQLKYSAKPIPAHRPRIASAKTMIVSDVIALSVEISSEKTLVITPGARDSLSNQDSYL
jgi:hypothetical protein